MYVLISSTIFVWDIYHSKKKWARYDKKFTLVFILSTSYFCQILTFNPLIAELNPICHLLALWGAHHVIHISRMRVKNRVSSI
jgi:hypothetical protein